MTAKTYPNTSMAPDGSSYVTLTDGVGNLVTAGGGGSGITIGTTSITGGATTQVLFNLAGVVSSDSGFTYAGSSGVVTTGGILRTSSAGSAPAPSLVVGNSTTGLYSVSTTGLGLAVNGVLELDFGITTAGVWTVPVNFIASGNTFIASLFIGNAATNFGIFPVDGANTLRLTSNASSTSYLNIPASAAFQFGQADAAAPVAQTLGVQSVVAGTSNTAGVNFTISGSKGTGTGLGGSIIFRTSLAGTTGTAQNAVVTGFTVKNGSAVLSTYTVATLPPAATSGTGGLAFVTDATTTAITGLGLAPTGGGANKVVVYSDGTNWLIL